MRCFCLQGTASFPVVHQRNREVSTLLQWSFVDAATFHSTLRKQKRPAYADDLLCWEEFPPVFDRTYHRI